MEFHWRVGHLFGSLRNRFALNTHALRIWVVHLLVYIYRLSNNKDIIIKLADKGGPTVILNTGNYITEAMLQLNNEEYYKRVEEDLTSQHEQLINQFISDW